MITELQTCYYYLVNFQANGHHYKFTLPTNTPVTSTSPIVAKECLRYYTGKKGTSLHKITNINLTLQKQLDINVPIQIPQQISISKRKVDIDETFEPSHPYKIKVTKIHL